MLPHPVPYRVMVADELVSIWRQTICSHHVDLRRYGVSSQFIAGVIQGNGVNKIQQKCIIGFNHTCSCKLCDRIL